MIEVKAKVAKEIQDDLAKVEETLGDLRSQLAVEAIIDGDTEIQVLVSIEALTAANHTLAKLIRYFTEQSRPEAEKKLLPETGPHLGSPALSRALNRVRRDYNLRTYGDLAELTRNDVVRCYQVGENGADALEALLKDNGQSFAVKKPQA